MFWKELKHSFVYLFNLNNIFIITLVVITTILKIHF